MMISFAPDLIRPIGYKTVTADKDAAGYWHIKTETIDADTPDLISASDYDERMRNKPAMVLINPSVKTAEYSLAKIRHCQILANWVTEWLLILDEQR